MKIIAAIISLVIASNVQAVPTVEGLFRNVNNKEPSGNLIVVTAMVSKMETASPAGMGEEVEKESAEETKKPAFYKWLISLEKEQSIDVIQVSYEDQSLKEDSVVASKYFPDLKKIVENDSSLERGMFYGLMSVLVLNDSSVLKNILNKYSQGFVSNKELMSREKINLYHRYKVYLEQRQSDEALVSPLEPEDQEKLSSVKETLSAPMYKDAGNVSLSREASELYWKVDLKSITALFGNEDHRLRKIEYQSPLGDLRVIADEYVLFNGSHELPKTMIDKDMAGVNWRVQFTGLSHLNTRSTPFTKRAQDYADAAKTYRKKQSAKATEQTVKLQQVQPTFIF